MIVKSSKEDEEGEEIDALFLVEQSPPLIVIQTVFIKIYLTLPLEING